MFRESLTVRTADEARLAIDRLRGSLDKSDILGASKSFLIDGARETLELWEAQLARPSTKSLQAEKIFEGSDYRIVLKVRSSRSGIIGLIRRAFVIG
jgi:hypothetical protein